MSKKVLSIDDSKAVRIIVKKAFKSYDVEVVEATNGVEGLSAAEKEHPDIILLDVTMPVMDGVEMLSKLKADASLKNIPVIMLTAEAGKENVMKIAKMGIRDYIVKPFKEDALLDKVSSVIEVMPQDDGSGPKKKMDDGLDILVVEDKPAIIKQMEKGLAHNEKWRIHGIGSADEAINFVGKQIPDITIISVSLPDDGAVNLFRFMRKSDDLKYIPTFGMAVKTAEEDIDKARQAGITSIVTKPIDFRDLENKIVKALKLDVSGRYFNVDDEALTIVFPADPQQDDMNQIDGYMKSKLTESVDAGVAKVIIDMTQLSGVDMKIITVVADAINACTDMGMPYGLVGNDVVVGECSGIEDSTEWEFFESVDDARENL